MRVCDEGGVMRSVTVTDCMTGTCERKVERESDRTISTLTGSTMFSHGNIYSLDQGDRQLDKEGGYLDGCRADEGDGLDLLIDGALHEAR